MTRLKKHRIRYLFFIPIFSFVFAGLVPQETSASTGTEVFRGFTGHISEQIRKDKQNFYEAQSCTTWFYKHIQQKPSQHINTISFSLTSKPPQELDCANRYPKGLEGLEAARNAFSQTQQSLSLSLTFFEFALVVDRDDDGQYNGGELNDLFDSFGMEFQDRLPSDRYILSLNGVFDSVREAGKLETLVKSMEVLLGKGYRFTHADQAALNHELE